MRRALIAVVVLLLLAGGVAVLYQRSDRAAAPIVLLLSDGASRVTLAPGTPIFLEAFVYGAEGTHGPSIGGAATPWQRSIELRATVNGQDVPFPAREVEPARLREISPNGDDAEDFREDRPRVARLDGSNRIYRAAFAVGPDDASRITTGPVQIVALIRSPWWQFWGWRGQAQSSAITVIIDKAASPAQDARRIALSARFFLNTAQFDRALQLAEAWAKQAPASAAAQTMLGDVHAAMGQEQPARTAYLHALDLVSTAEAEEPPAAILARLDRLRRAGGR
jgi:hypothetical protein